MLRKAARDILVLMIISFQKFAEIQCGCDYPSCGNKKHTMCLFPDTPDRSKQECNDDSLKYGLSDENKQLILDTHNELREKVASGKQSGQPSASNMLKLQWDDEVAEIAQHWVNSCTGIGHDDCRNLKNGTSVGQNAATTTHDVQDNEGKRLVDLVKMWFSEVESASLSDIRKFSGQNLPNSGHYTQFCWAETAKIGCGYLDTKQPSGTKRSALLICNYMPSGNFIDSPMYLEGDPCSKCPTGLKCSSKYPALCTGETNEDARIGRGSIHKITSLGVLLITTLVSIIPLHI